VTPRAFLIAALLVVAPAVTAAQTKKPPVTSTKKAPAKAPAKAPLRVVSRPIPPGARTTLSGVYTAEEASAGKEMYSGLCAGCHTAASHTGPTFKKKWTGRQLSDLFTFMRTMMPKNDPASLSDEDYGVLLAYMLQMNRMPAGRAYLSTDTTELAKIWIDTARAVPVRKP
jgi:mono/diheme cytochrome c family protein